MAKLGNFYVIDTILSALTPMEMIEAILTKAVNLYDMLANGVKWNIQNCGGGGEDCYECHSVEMLQLWTKGLQCQEIQVTQEQRSNQAKQNQAASRMKDR